MCKEVKERERKGKEWRGENCICESQSWRFSHSLFKLKTLLFGHLLQKLYHTHTVYVICNYTDFEPLWRIDYNNNIYALISSKTLLQPYNHTFSNSGEQNEASCNVCLDSTGNSICTLQFNSITISRLKATTERGT